MRDTTALSEEQPNPRELRDIQPIPRITTYNAAANVRAPKELVVCRKVHASRYNRVGWVIETVGTHLVPLVLCQAPPVQVFASHGQDDGACKHGVDLPQQPRKRSKETVKWDEQDKSHPPQTRTKNRGERSRALKTMPWFPLSMPW